MKSFSKARTPETVCPHVRNAKTLGATDRLLAPEFSLGKIWLDWRWSPGYTYCLAQIRLWHQLPR